LLKSLVQPTQQTAPENDAIRQKEEINPGDRNEKEDDKTTIENIANGSRWRAHIKRGKPFDVRQHGNIQVNTFRFLCSLLYKGKKCGAFQKNESHPLRDGSFEKILPTRSDPFTFQ
jgi:hypothetical protein